MGTVPENRTADRHRETPLSLRLGDDGERVTAAAERAGVPVRRWILDAVRERLEHEESGREAPAAATWQALLAGAVGRAPEDVRAFAAALAEALGEG